MREEFSKTINWLKRNSNQEYFDDIWNNKEELEKSNLDKISFENLLIKLEETIEKLIKQKEFTVLDIDQLENYHSSSISQKFIFINEGDLVYNIVSEFLDIYRIKGDVIFKAKKEFIMNILSRFDFVIPIKKMRFKIDGKKNNYLLLFYYNFYLYLYFYFI